MNDGMSAQPQQPVPKKKIVYVWDYFRGGNNPFASLLTRNSPENLRKKIEALKLQQELARLKKSPQEHRIET